MRRTTAERDRILDMLGRRQGYTDPIPYARVVASTGILRGTLRSMVRRDRRRMRADPAHPGHATAHATGETASTPGTMVCNDPRLDGRQAVAVEALAVGCSVVEVARLAEVDPSTVHRWRREPGFLAALEDARGSYAELVRSWLRSLALRGLADLDSKIASMDAGELRRVVEMALDRTGHGKSQTVEHAGGVEVSSLAHLTDEELDAEIARLEREQAQARPVPS